MDSPLRVVNDEENYQAFRSLLKSSSLPEDGTMVGTGALEVYGDFALLRSLSVKLGTRGKALGTAITEHLITEAKKRKLKGIYLLTETAHGFFLRKGFQDVARDQVPDPLKASSEFSHVCKDTAAAMHLDITA
jgi:amino-acid N-acetyltransferase